MPDMMDVRHVAELAKIQLTQEEESRLAAEMEGILALACRLQQLDLQNVLPTQHLQDLKNVLRADEVQPGLSQEVVLQAAPDREAAYIAVPRTVE